MTPYRNESPPGWSEQVAGTWEIDETPTRVRIWGACPTCGCASETVVDLTTGIKGGSRGSAGSLEVLVLCSCETKHPDQPPGETGCGRGGFLEVTLDKAP